jgi:hypothetical protein
MENKAVLDYAAMLIARLERLSADSHWAHRASGLRGSLWRCLEKLENDPPGSVSARKNTAALEMLAAQAAAILAAAAHEINAPEK